MLKVDDVVRVDGVVTTYGRITELYKNGLLVLDNGTVVNASDCTWVGRDELDES